MRICEFSCVKNDDNNGQKNTSHFANWETIHTFVYKFIALQTLK